MHAKNGINNNKNRFKTDREKTDSDKTQIKTADKKTITCKVQKINSERTKMLRMLQINLNNCRLAQDLLRQKVRELRIDVVILSEYLYREPKWIVDKSGKAAIWITEINGNINNDEDCVYGNGFVGTRVDEIMIVSVYISPNIKKMEYTAILEDIVKLRKETKGDMILAGDFNAKSSAWGSKQNDERGNLLYEAINNINLVPIVAAGGRTFEKNNRKSKIDILSCDRRTYERSIENRVLDTYTASDHRYVVHFFLKRQRKDKM
ncbi:uncharacterized protein LOC143182548 [Calliopsis andreniformis]|uniref:uncharacterized protein LOC143182548 n=1 Tax=Calliopsis andreniformis TaxID=337506 RepID=UPI003FCC32FC